MGFFTLKSKFSNSVAIKNYSENESKIKIIPSADFFYSRNSRAKLFQALVPSITKCKVI
jgi:hypothetical protein